MNEGQIRRKVFLRLLGHPVVLAPLVLGISACTAVWAFNWPPGLGWSPTAAGALASAGVYLTRLILDNGKTARAVIAEMEQSDQQSAQAALDDLDRRSPAAGPAAGVSRLTASVTPTSPGPTGGGRIFRLSSART